MPPPGSTVTIALQNGREVTAATEEWVGALILALPPALRDKVCELAEGTIKGPIVGGQEAGGVISTPGLRRP